MFTQKQESVQPQGGIASLIESIDADHVHSITVADTVRIKHPQFLNRVDRIVHNKEARSITYLISPNGYYHTRNTA